MSARICLDWLDLDAMTPEEIVPHLHQGIVITVSECWLFPVVREKGYGAKGDQDAHRWVYERLVGPVPTGMQLDHLCHTWDLTCAGGKTCWHRACVNPRHLEPVTPAENRRRTMIRSVHCPNGHPYSGENLAIWAGGARVCRACHRAKNMARDRANGVQPRRRLERETHCLMGHAYTPDNVITERAASGKLRTTCRACRRAAQRRYKERQRAS